MSLDDKQKFLWSLALNYSMDHQKICSLADKLSNIPVNYLS